MRDLAWRLCSLGELIRIKHGFAFQGEYFQDEPPGDILLTPGNFAIGGGFKADKFKYYSGPVPDEYILDEGDLIITMTDLSKAGDTLGYSAIVPEAVPGSHYLHNQRLGKVELLPDAPIDKGFLNYLLRTDDYRYEILASATGTSVKHTSPSRIYAYEFLLPPLDEQRSIAHILGSLDDKIEANRRMNATLEATARAIFKSWFVDFDPVHAKANGQAPSGMDAATAALFPDSFEDSELGPIPRGWGIGALDETIQIIGGGTPITSVPEYWDGDIPWFSVKDVPSETDVFVIDTEKRVTQAGVDNSSAKILPELTTIISARGTVGKLALTGIEMAMNQSCYAIRGLGYPDFFTYFNLKTRIAELQQQTHGTVFDTITRNTFSHLLTVLPSSQIAEVYDVIVAPILEQVRNNVFESRTLAETRDALLPRLVSGELRVGKVG